jgi:hypothetical protein
MLDGILAAASEPSRKLPADYQQNGQASASANFES